MPQVATPNFASDPRSLADIANVRVANMPDVWAWQDRAQQADQTSLADMMRAAGEERQLSPIRVQQANATLQDVLTGTEGKRLNNQKQSMENEVTAYTLPQKKIAEFADLISKASDAERKTAENKVYSMMQSPDPKVRAMGQQLYPSLKSALDKKYETDQQLRVVGAHEAGANARNKANIDAARSLEQMRIDAGKYREKGWSASFEQAFLKLKKAHEKYNTLIDAARVAEQNGNMDLAESYRARAEDLRPQAEAELRMLQKPGDVDLSARGIPTTPQGSIAPGNKKPDPLGIR